MVLSHHTYSRKPRTIIKPRSLTIAAGFFFGAAGALRAQTSPPASATLPVATATSASGGITIDGKLDEAAWGKATLISDFHQQQPNEGAAPTQRTEVRVLYDERAIYIGARMYDSLGAAGIRAPLQ